MARAKLPAERPKNDILQVRLPDEQWREVLNYCHEHNIPLVNLARLGLERALKKPPTRKELERCDGQMGRPASSSE